jgi:hypothetical protein
MQLKILPLPRARHYKKCSIKIAVQRAILPLPRAGHSKNCSTVYNFTSAQSRALLKSAV